jgi:NADH:ubiquinone oxidoreductase subunit 6 (subunit J)
MDLPIAILIVVGAAAAGFTAVVLARRTGSVLSNPTRGTPMAIVVGTSFAVLFAFLMVSAFQTYGGAKNGAASEADAVLDMSRTAALYRPSERDLLRSDLTCYGRAVINYEWPAMRQGHSSPLVDQWVAAYRAEFDRLTVRSPREQVAFQDLLTQGATRTVGRQQRLSDDTPAVPTPLWVALIFVGCVAVSLQLGMADRDERLRIQGLQVAGVAAVVATGLLIINFLDHPYATHVGGIQPHSMRHTLSVMHNLEPGLQPNCTMKGRPL